MQLQNFKTISFTVLMFLGMAYLVWSCNEKRSNESLSDTATLADFDSTVYQLPSVQERMKIIDAALLNPQPVIALSLNDAKLQEAQSVFIQSAAAQTFYKNEGGLPMLNEIFTVYKALPSDVQNACADCFRVEMYNYALNNTLVGFVDLQSKQVVQTNVLQASAPDVPEHLKRLAVDIAIHSAQVKKELGDAPEIKDAQMAYTKTALNNSKCERSLHLCVAPTFVKDKKALWSIVDLTDLRLVGTRWTYVGDPGPVRISERKIQNEKISGCYCEKENSINKSGWNLKYMLTSSDGLKIADVSYNGKAVLRSAKLVDWHVSYSNSDGFGYSDGVGCPTFSLSAVVAWQEPKIAELKVNGQVLGFTLEQEYRSEGWPAACNYNYAQRFEFYNDGKFRVAVASLGRGCGNDGTYRPVLRIAFEGKNNFAEYDGTQYQNWTLEKWSLQKENTPYSAQGYAYKVSGEQNYFVEPARGQFADKGRGDNAYVYVTAYKPEEGESDLVTIGPCCNNDYHQGPEKFIEPQAEYLNEGQIVLWYVPQMKNDDTKGKEYCWAEAKIEKGRYVTTTYPCFAGPMFVPAK